MIGSRTAVAVFILGTMRCLAQDSTATLAWDGPTNGTVAGYRLYIGTVSHAYSSMTNAGNNRQFTMSNLTNGITYFFAATAYDTHGVESDYSQEVSYTPVSSRPPPGTTLTLTMTNGAPVIQGQGAQGQAYRVEATTDFVAWTVIGNVSADSLGHFSLADSGAAGAPARFYRAAEVASSPALVTLTVIRNPGQFPIIQGAGLPNHTYEVRATGDFVTWTTVGTATASASGQFSVTDSSGRPLAMRFYSARDITP